MKNKILAAHDKSMHMITLIAPFDVCCPNNNTILHFIETRLQYNWHNNKNADGLVNRLASNLIILNQG